MEEEEIRGVVDEGGTVIALLSLVFNKNRSIALRELHSYTL